MSDLTRQTQAVQQQQAQTRDAAGELTRAVYGTKNEITKALGDRIGPDRFLRALATEIRTTEHLAECTPESVLGGMFVAAQMGLELGAERGLAYLVPRKNNKAGGRWEASLQVGYKGWIDLFYGAGARAVQWFLVREGDVFRIGSSSSGGKTYEWLQADVNSTRRVTGAVAQIVTATGGIVWEYMTRADIEKRSTDTPFWRGWWDEMALKTVLHRLAATAPLSDRLALAQRADETVQRKVPGIEQPVGEHLPLIATPTQQQRPAHTAPQQQPQAAQERPKSHPPREAPPAGQQPQTGPGGEISEDDWAEIERQQYEDEMARQAEESA